MHSNEKLDVVIVAWIRDSSIYMTAKIWYGTAVMTKYSIQQSTVGPDASTRLHTDTKGDGHTSTKQGTVYILRSGVSFTFILRPSVTIATVDEATTLVPRPQGSKCVEVLDTPNFGFNSPAVCGIEGGNAKAMAIIAPEVGLCLCISNMESAVTSHL